MFRRKLDDLHSDDAAQTFANNVTVFSIWRQWKKHVDIGKVKQTAVLAEQRHTYTHWHDINYNNKSQHTFDFILENVKINAVKHYLWLWLLVFYSKTGAIQNVKIYWNICVMLVCVSSMMATRTSQRSIVRVMVIFIFVRCFAFLFMSSSFSPACDDSMVFVSPLRCVSIWSFQNKTYRLRKSIDSFWMRVCTLGFIEQIYKQSSFALGSR